MSENDSSFSEELVQRIEDALTRWQRGDPGPLDELLTEGHDDSILLGQLLLQVQDELAHGGQSKSTQEQNLNEK